MISAVVCSKNRTGHLEQAIKSWIACPEIDEIIVLDWGSDDPIVIAHNKVKVYRTDQKLWHLTKAYNVAVQLACGEQILKLDADYVLDKEFLTRHKLRHGMFYSGQSVKSKNHCQGLILFWKKDFILCNGYNERLVVWGYDDTDLSDRLKKLGLTSEIIDFHFISHLDHSDVERMRYSSYTSIARMPLVYRNNKNSCEKNPWTFRDKMTNLSEVHIENSRIDFSKREVKEASK